MGPGVPGIGIAGLFYVIAAIVAPLRELYLTARGRSSRARWGLVLRQFVMAWAIVASVVAFYVGLNWLAHRGWLGAWGDRGLHLLGIPNVVVGLGLLVVVVLLTTAYAIAVRRRTVDDPEVVAFDHRHSIIRSRGDRTLVPVPASDGTAQPSPAPRLVPARRANVVFSESIGIVVYADAG